jgi:hypothetical protein
MRSSLPPFENLLKKAVANYWRTLNDQSSKQKSGDADRGGRAAVTGGKQMDGFGEIVHKVLVRNHLPEASIFTRDRLELPGYFRPTKRWDMLVVHERHLVAAIEFKSQKGPSFGNNFNNRTEEALGSALDLWTAYREGAFGKDRPRPWLGWVMLLEECPTSLAPVVVKEPHFKVFEEFRSSSYAQRYQLFLRRLILEKNYDAAALLLATEKGGPKSVYVEPAADLTMKRLLAGLAGHVLTYVASI